MTPPPPEQVLWSTVMHSWHFPQPTRQEAITRSPSFRRVTPSPTACTVPTPSCPIGNPSAIRQPGKAAETSSFGNSSRKCMSLPQTVQREVLTMISPGPGSGTAMSTSSTLPLDGFTTARMATSVFRWAAFEAISAQPVFCGQGGRRELERVQESDEFFVDLTRALLLSPVAGLGQDYGLAQVGNERLHRLRFTHRDHAVVFTGHEQRR